MVEYINAVPASLFESIGIVAGLTACFVLLIQLIKEYRSTTPSSLSAFFLIGWIFIYGFWALYGVRFDALAIWLTNGIAFLLQIMLCVVVFSGKNRKMNMG